MLLLNRLLEYLAECKASIKDKSTEPITLFNYATMVVDDSELAKVLEERVDTENTFLIAVMPEFNMKGVEDNAEWQNILAFFILDKTDYSEHDRDSFINIFVTTQIKAKAFVDKLLDDKANHSGVFCNFLAKLDESSITVKPVWKKNGCNGWMVEVNFDSPL
jgi:hypothetical protein